GAWSACQGRVQPFPGMCNYPSCAGGENPGCDCRVGDPVLSYQTCYSGPDGTNGKGICANGTKTCVDTAGGSKWSDCLGEIDPLTEDCSGNDADCDGTPGTACTCAASDTRACQGVTGGSCNPGQQACVSGSWGTCDGRKQPKPGNCDE